MSGGRARGWIVLTVLAVVSGELRPNTEDGPQDNAAVTSTEPSAAETAMDDACSRRADRVRRLLGGAVVVVEPPFVLSGDLPESALRTWHAQAIAPASAALARQFDLRAPDEPITVLLFHSEAAYRETAARALGDRDVSRWGYYRPHGRTLLVNASAGRGPLLHELTHALVAFDFPEIPRWFDEGLASLNEECRIEGDPPRIAGLPNGRDRRLAAAIGAGTLPPLAEFVGPASPFGRAPARDYAYARGLCRYLQDLGLLSAYYRGLRSGQANDPSGSATLREILGGRSWKELQTAFQTWAQADARATAERVP